MTAPSVIIQKKRLRPSISVTPGMPPIIETRSDIKLTGKVTPVNIDVRFTASNVAAPHDADKKLRLIG